VVLLVKSLQDPGVDKYIIDASVGVMGVIGRLERRLGSLIAAVMRLCICATVASQLELRARAIPCATRSWVARSMTGSSRTSQHCAARRSGD